MMVRFLPGFLSIILLFAATLLFAQSNTLIDRLSELADDNARTLEVLNELMEYPIDINKANRQDFMQIPVLTMTVVDSIITFRERQGPYTRKNQLTAFLGRDLYQLIKPFISISTVKKTTTTLLSKNQLPLDFENNNYQGNDYYFQNKGYFRYKKSFSMGIVTQKDPGEVNYFDFISGYIKYQSALYTLIGGKFYLHFGHGLNFSNPYGKQKSSLPLIPFRVKNPGGYATLSSSEGVNFTGLYGDYRFNESIGIYLFGTITRRDVQLATNDQTIVGFDYDGYHRTETELHKKNGIEEKVFGVAVNHSISPLISWGIVLSSVTFSEDVARNSEVLSAMEMARTYFNFTGKAVLPASLYYTAQLHDFEFSGEFALSNFKNAAISQSVYLKKNRFKFGLNYWMLDKNFQSPHGRSFGDSSPFPRGKEGYYSGIFLKLSNTLNLRAYKLFEQDLWRTYFSPVTLKKNEWFSELELKQQQIELFGRYRFINREEYMSGGNEQPPFIHNNKQHIFRLQANYQLRKYLSGKTRWETNRIVNGDENGTLLYQDFSYQPERGISISSRISYFRTSSYDSRIYEYEYDLPGSFSNYALYGEGYKYYILFKIQMHKYLLLYFKYRYSFIQNKAPYSFSFYSPESRLSRELRCMLRVKF